MKRMKPLRDWEKQLIREYSDPKLYQGELSSKVGRPRKDKTPQPIAFGWWTPTRGQQSLIRHKYLWGLIWV